MRREGRERRNQEESQRRRMRYIGRTSYRGRDERMNEGERVDGRKKKRRKKNGLVGVE